MPQHNRPTVDAGRLPEIKPEQRSAARPTPAAPRLHTVYDLLLLIAAALLALALAPLQFPPLATPLALIVVLFAPGYALTAALFAGSGSLDGVARAALSFGLSLAVIPLLALLLDALPWGIRPLPVALAIALWVFALSVVAALRRYRLGARGAYTPPRLKLPGRWAHGLPPVRALLGTAALLGVGAVGALALFGPDPTERLTEFYVLGDQGRAEGYPREAQVGAVLQLQLGIANREEQAARYRVEARRQGQLIGQLGPLPLEPGAVWEGSLDVAPDQPGDDQSIDILLFRDDEPAPYRQLRLWLDVRRAGAARHPDLGAG